MAWVGASSPWGFEIRGEGLVCSVDARGVRVTRGRRGAESLALVALLLAPALVLLALGKERAPYLALPALLLLAPLALRFGAMRRWHGAEHKVVEALLLVEEGVEPEEAWRRAKALSPACGTVAVGISLPIALALLAIYPPLAPLAVPLGLFLHMKLPRSSPLRLPGFLLERLFVAEPGPLEEARAREAFQRLAALLRERG
jgi:hypothetical protein